MFNSPIDAEQERIETFSFPSNGEEYERIIFLPAAGANLQFVSQLWTEKYFTASTSQLFLVAHRFHFGASEVLNSISGASL